MYVYLQARIFTMMNKYRRSGFTAEIERIFLTNSIVGTIGYTILLLYMTVNNIYYPMSDIVGGKIGCFIILQFLDTYVRYFSQLFPIAVAGIRLFL